MISRQQLARIERFRFSNKNKQTIQSTRFIKKLIKNINTLKSQNKKLNDTINFACDTLEELEGKYKDKIEQYDNKIRLLKDKIFDVTKDCHDEKNVLLARNRELQNEINKVKEELNQKTSELDSVMVRFDLSNDDIKQIQDGFTNYFDSNNDNFDNLENLI